ncbi:type II toxin-antitoxin system HicA family toxin [Variovorax atrisoli]|uniref:type II toxin-antitoxin system HicA family toxin n=1 Tax=Variovorax atrisoli TaxID=3394203 RepID=UPI0016169287|nr:type II toxin-antitoxin system HicA family toxin [Variovorax sp. BK613]MBB3639819.1 putative RNA binding protein YcfA (HicA-like mRNA interferase family) [Variovorax sp. BK613]
MSKHAKALEKLCRTPPPADFKWDDLRTVLEGLGYVMLNGSGSRRKFHHPGIGAIISCHEPHPSPDVDKGCIVDIVAHLKDYGLI